MNTRQAEERRHEIKVGLTILIGLTLLIISIFYVGENQGILAKRYQLHIMMSRVNGLQPGAPVQLAGVRVGTVVSVEFSNELHERKIDVAVEIDQKVQPRIRLDSEAYIGTLGLLGDKYIGISLGSPDRPVLNAGEYLTGTDPVDVEKLIDEGVQVFAQLKQSAATINEIADKVNNGQGTVGLLINDPRMYYNLDRLLVLMERLSRRVDESKGTFVKLLQDSTLYDNLNRVLLQSGGLLDSLQYGAGLGAKLLNDPHLFVRLTNTIERLHGILYKMEKGEGSLGKVLNDEQLYEQSYRVLKSLDSLAQDLKKNPRRYINVKIF